MARSRSGNRTVRFADTCQAVSDEYSDTCQAVSDEYSDTCQAVSDEYSENTDLLDSDSESCSVDCAVDVLRKDNSNSTVDLLHKHLQHFIKLSPLADGDNDSILRFAALLNLSTN